MKHRATYLNSFAPEEAEEEGRTQVLRATEQDGASPRLEKTAELVRRAEIAEGRQKSCSSSAADNDIEIAIKLKLQTDESPVPPLIGATDLHRNEASFFPSSPPRPAGGRR
jgi:hypothetical protein